MEFEPQGLINYNVDLIGSATSTEEIIDALARRSCPNLTMEINPSACSGFPVAGGGFCDVFQSALYDGTVIAIKSLRIYDRPAAKGDGDKGIILKRAAKELYHWSRLRHRNILPLMGLAIFRSYLSMVSPWMENGSLVSYIRSNPDINRIKLCMDISEGLCYIHLNEMARKSMGGPGFVHGLIRSVTQSHGDLKAANIMVSADGTAIIADFGNAQLKEITLQFTGTAKSGLSVRWAAPELLLRDGEPQVSKEADVYAYGMTILETLTGKIPYDGINENRVIYLVTYEHKAPPRPDIDISDNLWDLINSCWIQEPSDRPGIAKVHNCLKSLFPLVARSGGEGKRYGEEVYIKHSEPPAPAPAERIQISAPSANYSTLFIPPLSAQLPQVPAHAVGIDANNTQALYAPLAGPDDPAEVSFAAGENLRSINIVDGNGKRWRARSYHSGTHEPPLGVMPIAPHAVTEPRPTITKDEAQRVDQLSAQVSADFTPSSSARISGVDEERNPEASQMTLLNARPVSFHSMAVREPGVVSEPVTETEVVAAPEHLATLERVAYPHLAEGNPILPTVSVSAQGATPVSPLSARSLDPSILDADFVEDVSIIDGQFVPGGAEFTKCWRMRNSGPTTWPKGTTISFVDGAYSMLIQPGMIHWAVTGDLSPGQEVDVEVNLKAPEEPGSYTSYWRLKTPKGAGFGTRVWCEIAVTELEHTGSSGSNEIPVPNIVVPAYVPGISASDGTTTMSSSFHSAMSTIRTPSPRDPDTADIESLGSVDSADSGLWEEVRRQTATSMAQAAARSEAGRFEVVNHSD